MSLKENLQAALLDLKNGESVTVSHTQDKDGNKIVKASLSFDDKRGFIFSNIQCTESSELNLGTCPCKHHRARSEEEADLGKVLRQLYLKRQLLLLHL